MRRALVVGGTGTLGEAVLRRLAALDVPCDFTYLRSASRASAIVESLNHRAHAVDLRQPDEIDALFDTLSETKPSVMIYCAARAYNRTLSEITPEDASELWAVNCRSALLCAKAFARFDHGVGGAEIVFSGALDKNQAFAIPVDFAMTQGALQSMTMALAKELGGRNIRVNMVCLGPMGAGLSNDLDPKVQEDFRAFSALRRMAAPEEAANVIAWLGLGNTLVSGKTIAVNGGI